MRWKTGAWLATVLASSACGETSQNPSSPPSVGGAAGTGSPSTPAGSSAGGRPAGAAGAAGEPQSGAGAGGDRGLAGEGGAAGEAWAGAAQGGEPTDPGPGRPNRVFITSKRYVLAELGGVEGADAACAERAEAAGLPGTFVAWLSTSAVSARDRLGAANGWINTQGNPFADRAEELLGASQVYYPIAFDENQQRVTAPVATGTSADGSAANQNCQDYTSKSAADALVTGDPTGGSVVWTAENDGAACDAEYHLYCFEIGGSAALYPTPSQGRTAFVSSQPFVLGAQGRAAADALCAADAADAELSGTYVALLPTSTESALDRLTQPSRPWVRPDGAVVANATSALLIGPLRAAITEQADGKHVGGAALFGADDLGQKATLHCDDWKNPNAAVPAVIHGTAGHTDERWYAAVTAACSESARVLCVEQ